MNPRIPQVLAGSLLALTLTACSVQDAVTRTSDASATSTDTSASGTTAAVAAVAAGTTAEEVLAANAAVHSSSLEYDEADVRDITLEGTSASSDADGVRIDGAAVTITAPGTYRLTGTLTDGQVVVDSAAEGLVQVILNDVDITSSTTSALAVSDADEAVVLLADGTANSLSDAAEYVYPDAATDEPNAALFSTADLTIAGGGALTVTGNANDGIASKDGLVIESGTVTVTAADDGIRGKDYLVVTGGDITVEAAGDGLKADNDEDAEAGFVVLAGGTVSVTSGDDGVTAATDIVVTGGQTTVAAGGGARSASSGSTSTEISAKGLVAAAALVVGGGSLTVDAADDALHSNAIATLTAGEIELAAGDDGVHADTDLTIAGGTLTVTRSYEGLESANLKIADGTITVTATDDGINVAGGDGSNQAGPGDQAGDFGTRPAPGTGGSGDQPAGGGGSFEAAGDFHLTISGGQVVVNSGGDGLDSNGTAEMTGGVVVVNGPENAGNGAIDVNGTFEISGGTLMATGSAGMAEAPEDTSAQAWIAGTFDTSASPGTVLAIEANGKVLATFTATKAIQSLVYSSAELVSGESYDVYTGATATGTSVGGLTTQGSTGDADLVGSTTASGGTQ